MDEGNGKKIAYFSMEYAIDQSLSLYSGGLGFLSGSHMRSAYALKQNIVAIGLLYTNGYYDQGRDENGYMKVEFISRNYPFLQDTGIAFTLMVHDAEVHVKAYYLPPDTFGTAPLYLLTTDFEENDALSRSITQKLYPPNQQTKIAQSIVLGVGGAKLLEQIRFEPDLYHLNEGHGLSLLFYLYGKYKSADEVKKRFVFTSHTPEAAGNDEISMLLLKKMSFFGSLSHEEINTIAQIGDDKLNFTLTALHTANIANGVSRIHKEVMDQMWGNYEGVCPIISITNAQSAAYWTDTVLKEKLRKDNDEELLARKKELKLELFKEVARQTGKLFDPEVLTIVWARRFAGYKRADLILKNYQKFLELVNRSDKPIQIIWAGKPYPEDQEAIGIFNHLIAIAKPLERCAVLTGYELSLSALLKKGTDVWLNTPRPTREASGTSGMSASMNGAVNFSISDGWVPEFARHGQNSFIIPSGAYTSIEELDEENNKSLLTVLENEIIPIYYQDKARWTAILKAAMKEVVPAFDSDRMAKEYYYKMYRA